MEQVIVFGSVFIVALIFSMFGMGGGLIYMPLFLLFIADYKVASILSFSCIGVTAVAAMNVYHREKMIDWNLVRYLGVPLVAMVFLTGFILKVVPVLCIKLILGLTFLLAGIVMVSLDRPSRGGGSSEKRYQYPPVYFSPVAMVVGILSGISGVAGGVFEIPLMTSVLRVPAHTAVATSSVIVSLAAVLGLGGRFIANHNEVDIPLSFILGILLCAFAGGRLGPKISLNISKRQFKKFCGVFVLMIGAYYIVQFWK